MDKMLGDEALQKYNDEFYEDRLLIKICGMKYPPNIKDVVALNPDFLGFIFYRKSPRYVEPFPFEALNLIPPTIKKTGVFVNEKLDDILTVVHRYKLDAVQLHGHEMERTCRKLRETGLTIIKAFPIETAHNFIPARHYEGLCDYFLFDTKSDSHGGSGNKFNWNILHEYNGKTPFLLSGGIDSGDVSAITRLNHPKLAGVDLNSRFETKPGLKDVSKLKEFLNALGHPESFH